LSSFDALVEKENCYDNPKFIKARPGQYKPYENDSTIQVKIAKAALRINNSQ